MKRNKLIAGLLIIALVSMILFYGNKTQISTLTVSSPVFVDKTMEYLHQSDKWRDWLPAGDTSFAIRTIDPLTLELAFKKGDSASPVARIQVSPVTEAEPSSKIQIHYPAKRYQNWFGNPPQQMAQLAEKLDRFFNDTKELYGYAIEHSFVEDTSYLFKKITIPTDLVFEKLPLIYDSLIQFARKQHLEYRGVRIFNIHRLDSTHCQLNASIAIHGTPALSDDNIFLKQMPYKKNLLVAYYRGSITEADKALEALEKYRGDHGLIRMAIPFVQLPADDFNLSDTAALNIKVFYPVF
jgi:hypothetical protein